MPEFNTSEPEPEVCKERPSEMSSPDLDTGLFLDWYGWKGSDTVSLL
jgi:hypothetical protein